MATLQNAMPRRRSTPCTNAAYLDSAHSSVMWKAMRYGTENWNWVNYGYQDGGAAPSGINDGCDPATYTCFMLLGEGSLARVPNASILDVSAWTYYTCPAITQNYRCPGSDPANWTPTYANRTPVLYLTWYLGTFHQNFTTAYSVTYLKEFKSYVMTGISYGSPWSANLLWAPTLQGPWTTFHMSAANQPNAAFFSLAPALGYTVVSSDPPHVQVGASQNGYGTSSGTPQMSVWDLVLGRLDYGGEAFALMNRTRYVSGAGYQFSDGNLVGSFPRKGLAWSFDYLDAGKNSSVTNWPFFLERGNKSAVIVACDGTYNAPANCGSMNPGHGTSMNPYGIQTIYSEYGGHFRTYPAESSGGINQNAPPSMQGNGSYSVVGVYRYEGVTPFGRLGGIWSTGVSSDSDNTMVELNQLNGNLVLEWNATHKPHYRYVSTFTFPNFTNWYFIAVTVQAQTSCGSNCTPEAKIWVGGADSPGVLKDVNAGVSYTTAPATTPAVSTRTPNVSAGPLILGINAQGENTSMSVGTTMVYNRALTSTEVQLIYQGLKSKMKERGVVLQ